LLVVIFCGSHIGSYWPPKQILSPSLRDNHWICAVL